MAGNNKIFVMIAILLVGMLVLGLLAIGGVVAFGTFNRGMQAARPTATSTLPAIAQAPTPTWTPTATPTPIPSNTPLPTETATPVVMETPGSGGEVAAQGGEGGTATPTYTPTGVPGATPAAQGSTPDTGIGGLEAVLIGAGLIAVLFITRRLRAGRAA